MSTASDQPPVTRLTIGVRPGEVRMDAKLEQKLDARGRYLLRHNRIKGSIDVLVRAKSPLGSQELNELRLICDDVTFSQGNVASATVANPTRLAQVARLLFVARIEISRPLVEE